MNLKFDKTRTNAHIGLFLLRISSGFLMLTLHGIPKLTKYSELSSKFADPIGLGSEISLILVIFAEVLCSFLLILGLFTRWILLPLIFTMFIAIFVIHGGDDFATKEKGILYGIIYVVLLISGPSKYSLDSLIKKK